MSKFCCDRDCNQGRDCPNRKPQEIKWLIYNNVGYISAFISFLTFGIILFEL